jgi:phage baseplate assembly protein W
MDYLALPFVLRDGYLERASLQESITFSVGLLLSTRQGMMHFDRDYGCDIWNKEFSDLYAANKADIRASLRNAINKYEERLYNVSVSFVSVEDTAPHSLGLAVKVSGNYKDGTEEKKFEASYTLG